MGGEARLEVNIDLVKRDLTVEQAKRIVERILREHLPPYFELQSVCNSPRGIRDVVDR